MKEENLIANVKTTIDMILGLTQTKIYAPNDDKIKNIFKIIVLDQVSIKILSPVLKQSNLNKNNICLTVNISEKKEKISDIMAIYIVTPSKSNLDNILKDIINKTYDNYSLNFIDIVDDYFQDFITQIIQKDAVKNIYNINVYPMKMMIYHPRVFSLDIPNPYFLLNSPTTKEEDSNQYIQNLSNGLFSIMLMTRTSPIVTYRKGWFVEEIIKKVQNRFNSTFKKFPELKTEFDFTNPSRNLMIILNRDEDLPIIFHHSLSLGAIIHDIYGIKEIALNENDFTPDPINDFIWNNSITLPYYDVGEKILIDYKKYDSEMTMILGKKKEEKIEDKGNLEIDELTKQSEKIASSIENLNEQKVKGDILSKHAMIFSKINELQVKKHILEIFKVENPLLLKRKVSKEIEDNLKDITNNKLIFKDNIDDIFRMCLIHYIINNDIKKEEIKKFIGESNLSSKMISILDYLEVKKKEKNVNNPNENQSTGLAKKFLKKGLMYLVNSYNNLMPNDQPSILADTIHNVIKGKKDKEFTNYIINEKFYGRNCNDNLQGIKNVFVFIVGGGCLSELEYIHNLLKDQYNMNTIYGCDKLYNANEFVEEIGKLAEIQK